MYDSTSITNTIYLRYNLQNKGTHQLKTNKSISKQTLN